MFLKFLGEVTSFVLSSNLRITIGAKSENVKNIEAWKISGILLKKIELGAYYYE